MDVHDLLLFAAGPGRGETIGWGTLSLINAGLAQSKNRSGLGWGLASLLIGPVATFLIVILDRKREATDESYGPQKRRVDDEFA